MTKLSRVTLATPAEVGPYIIRSAQVGQQLSTWRDGPVVEAIETDGLVLTVRMGDGHVLVTTGSWSGEVLYPAAEERGTTTTTMAKRPKGRRR